MSASLIGSGSDRPQVTLMTALPLMWGEGSPADVLSGRSERSATLRLIDKAYGVRAIDTISAATLGPDLAILAQPRRLTPQELVALDKWIRGGGKAMIFADPELVWPSELPAGDTRRAPPVTLLDPLLSHWGVALGDSDGRVRVAAVDGTLLATVAAGKWTSAADCEVVIAEVLDCRIDDGRVLLVGDADVLDARFWQANGGDNAAWMITRLRILSGDARMSAGPSKTILAAGFVTLLIAAGALYRWRRRT